MQHKEIIQEKSVVETFELNSPPCALVRMELISVKLNDREPDVFALKMPRYLTVLSDYTKMWTDHLIREGLRLVEAVEYMHARNVVHVDIKLSNILFGSKGPLNYCWDHQKRSVNRLLQQIRNSIPER